MQKLLLFVFVHFLAFSSYSQLEKVIVEKYYVSDAVDATDTLGGGLAVGSTTYRIYVDLAPGSVLKKIYGDANHPFSISSTQPFFNQKSDGQTFAKDFIKNRYLEGVVALDTWLTLGQTTKTQAGKTHFGLLKTEDVNGSFIGGINNDGGSAMVSTGLLTNADPSAGIPLTQADGMDTLATVPGNWNSYGVIDFVTGNDSTMFGSIVAKNEFISNNFYLSNSGVKGIVADSNQILVAQLTTTGELSFHLNIAVDAIVNGLWQTINYVSSNDTLITGEEYNAYLSYPNACGCNNPDFLEYDPTVICFAPGSCVTPIILGCMDTLACNFDSQANVNVPSLCCFPGKCSNRDIAIVCPDLRGDNFDFLIYPNPTQGDFFLDVYNGRKDQAILVQVYNTYGVNVYEQEYAPAMILTGEKLNFSSSDKGLYHIKVTIGEQIQTQLLFKN